MTQRIIVDARLEERLPAPPPGKLAPAFDAALKPEVRQLIFDHASSVATLSVPLP